MCMAGVLCMLMCDSCVICCKFIFALYALETHLNNIKTGILFGNSHYSAHKCNAVCNGCEDGLCLFPNLCDCDDGYRWEASELKCIPICTPNCINGECIAPNNCSCNENYYFNETLHACIPDCQNGYRFQADAFDVCQPICEPDCQNAKCVAPNECECNDPDYEKSITSNATHVCCPICASAEDCMNGTCTSEGDCDCFEHFGLDNHHVLPNEPLATTVPKHNQSIFNW